MLIQSIVNGILLGGIYATIGIGFSLVWGVMNIINIAHGGFIIIGAYFSFVLFAKLGIDPFLSIPIVMILLFFIGFVIQRFVLNLIVRGSVFLTLTLTFGLQIVIFNVCLLIWGADFRSVKLSYSAHSLTLGDIIIPSVRLGVFFVALLLTYLFYLFMQRTKTGIAINATALNLEGAKTVGVNVGNIYALTFGISAALAGAAGAMISPIMSFNPFLGNPLIGKAFIIAILGGLGSTAGALIGGLILALVENVGTVFVATRYQELLAFSAFILVLILRPQGILGKRFY